MGDSVISDINGHSRRVAQISRILADEGGRKEEADLIELCALLHDIGKLDVPPEILEKPGKLTPEEYKIAKTHALSGSEHINRLSASLEIAALIARFHHEQWSGGGYEGVEAESIHPYARIVAIADVFDALASKRPYKDSLPLEDVYEYMRDGAGKHFDPALINTLLSCKEQVSKIYERGDEK